MIQENWQEKLFSEKSFGALYKAARSLVAVKSSLLVSFLVFSLAVVPFLIGLAWVFIPVDISAIITGIRIVAVNGVSFCTSILGFLVSGFAHFFAITRPDVLLILAGVTHEKSPISRLQFILYSFMYVFLHYIVYLAVCLAISTMLSAGSVLVPAASSWDKQSPMTFYYAAVVMFGLLSSWLAFSLLLLKTFIWNLFQTVLIAISVGADMDGGRLDRLLAELKGKDPGSRGYSRGASSAVARDA